MEEDFREASCIGNIEAVKKLLNHGVNINSQNAVNGWTALHWAVKRDHKDIVDVLLHAGAKKDMKNNNGLTPFDLAPSQTSTSAPSSIVESQGTKLSVSATSIISEKPQHSSPSFIPNYLKNPVFPYMTTTLASPKNAHSIVAVKQNQVVTEEKSLVNESKFVPDKRVEEPSANVSTNLQNTIDGNFSLNCKRFLYQPQSFFCVSQNEYSPCGLCVDPNLLVLKVCVENKSQELSSKERDFIEISFNRKVLPTFENFKNVLRWELDIDNDVIIRKIRKLPNSLIRNEEDVQRLTDYQMLVVEVGKTSSSCKMQNFLMS